MKILKSYFVLMFTALLLAGSVAQAQTPQRGWSGKAKGAAVGAGAGAVTGAVVGGGKGAIVGAAVGAVGGGILGRRRDRKRDPVRYNNYRNKR